MNCYRSETATAEKLRELHARIDRLAEGVSRVGVMQVSINFLEEDSEKIARQIKDLQKIVALQSIQLARLAFQLAKVRNLSSLPPTHTGKSAGHEITWRI